MFIVDVLTFEQSGKNESSNKTVFESEEATTSNWFKFVDVGIVFGVTILASLSIILAKIVTGYVQSKPLEFLRLVDLIYSDIARF